jgi:hypothetical protein
VSPERWARIKDLFDAACQADPRAREALLAQECGSDTELRAEVERLLDSRAPGDDFLEARRSA